MSNLVYFQQMLLQDIFEVKVTPESSYRASSIFLPQFSQEVGTMGPECDLVKNCSIFDSMLMERMGVQGQDTLHYLLESYLRGLKELDSPVNRQLGENAGFIKYSLEIILNFLELSITTPELFPESRLARVIEGQEGESRSAFILVKLILGEYHYLVSEEVLQDLLGRLLGQSANRAGFMEELFRQVDSQDTSIFDSKAFSSVDTVIQLVEGDESLRQYFLENNLRVPGQTGQQMEENCLLGRMLRVGIYSAHPRVMYKYQEDFGKIKYKKDFDMRVGQYSERQEQYVGRLLALVKALMKKGGQGAVLGYFQRAVTANKKRSQMVNRLQNRGVMDYASDQYMLNCYDVLLQLSKVFLVNNHDLENNQYIQKIDPSYFEDGFYKEETVLNSKVEKSQESKKSVYGSVSEFFFLSLLLSHRSLIPCLQANQDTHQMLENSEKKLEALKAQNPNNYMVKMMEQEVQNLKNKQMQCQVLLHGSARLKNTLELYDLLARLVLSWVKTPQRQLVLRSFPEHLLLDIYEVYSSFMRFNSAIGPQLNSQRLLTLLDLFMASSDPEDELLTNPYVAAKVLQLFQLFLQTEPGMVTRMLQQSYRQGLMQQLVHFYIQIEFTDNSNSFYLKYQYRQCCAIVLVVLSKVGEYQKDMQSLQKSSLYERFINMILNDFTYCMDEVLEKLDAIANNRPPADGQMEPGQQASEEQQQNINVQNCKYFLEHSQQSLDVMKVLALLTPESLLQEAFLERLACLLNNYLKQLLTGQFQKHKALLNTQMRKYFDSNKRTSDLLAICCALSHEPAFIGQVVNDGRSFDMETYDRLCQMVDSNQIRPQSYQAFQEFIVALQSAHPDKDDFYSKLGDIPEQFICPISMDLMRQPVLMPTSNQVVERHIIKQHLLNDEIDPFNRKPLKISQLVDQVELKKQIDDFIKSKLCPNQKSPMEEEEQ